MPSIGGWWITSFDLEPGEEEVASYSANYRRGDDRPWGGRLYVTSDRLVFLPHFIDRFLGGHPVEIDLTAIAAVDRESSPGTTSVAKQIRVVRETGEDAFFVVSKPDDTIERIRETQAQQH